MLTHRRRLKTEAKTKVVASVWGKEFIQFLAALDILHRTIFKNWMISSFSSNHPGAIHAIFQFVLVHAAQGIE